MKKVSKKLLKKSIDTLNIGPRIYQKLKEDNVHTLADLCAYELYVGSTISKAGYYMIKNALRDHGLEINTDYLSVNKVVAEEPLASAEESIESLGGEQSNLSTPEDTKECCEMSCDTPNHKLMVGIAIVFLTKLDQMNLTLKEIVVKLDALNSAYK